MGMSLSRIIRELKGAESIRAGALLLEEVGRCLNLPKVGCAHDISLPVGPDDDDGIKLADIWGWPQPFADEWADEQLTLHTPFFVECRFRHLPFTWIAEEDLEKDSSRRGRQIVRAMTKFGYAHALIVPLHLPKSRVAAISWWGDCSRGELDRIIDDHGAELLGISHYFINLLGDQAVPDLDREHPSPPSVREIECLTLAAQGLSDVEIAHDMDISVHTVRYYINTVAKRLGARNRTHAVALASQMGVIGLTKAQRS